MFPNDVHITHTKTCFNYNLYNNILETSSHQITGFKSEQLHSFFLSKYLTKDLTNYNPFSIKKNILLINIISVNFGSTYTIEILHCIGESGEGSGWGWPSNYAFIPLHLLLWSWLSTLQSNRRERLRSNS